MENKHHPELLAEIEEFLASTGMGETHFGKAAVGNSEVVRRLRRNGRVWPETETGLRSFLANRLSAMQNKGAA